MWTSLRTVFGSLPSSLTSVAAMCCFFRIQTAVWMLSAPWRECHGCHAPHEFVTLIEGGDAWRLLLSHISYVYTWIPGPQMTLVLILKDLVLERGLMAKKRTWTKVDMVDSFCWDASYPSGFQWIPGVFFRRAPVLKMNAKLSGPDSVPVLEHLNIRFWANYYNA